MKYDPQTQQIYVEDGTLLADLTGMHPDVMHALGRRMAASDVMYEALARLIRKYARHHDDRMEWQHAVSAWRQAGGK